MNRRYAREHLSDQIVLQSAVANAARERTATADLLADLAEIDDRKLYLPLAYPSMLAYCTRELHLCEQAALKRIRVARAARRFPAIFEAVAAGRLALTAILLLAPHLTEETAGELLSAATHKSKAQIERLLAERYPSSDVLAWITPASPVPTVDQHAPAHVEVSPGTVACVHGVAKVTPLSSQSFALQVTVDAETHEDLRYAQALLGHRVRSGDLAQVLGVVLKIAIRQLEKQKFAAADHPRANHRESANPRHIPAHVKRAVFERDGGRCAFVSEDGRRCQADTGLEFDHVIELARGGEATVDGVQLLCRAHNQYAAERTFGSEFMRHKRIAGKEFREAARSARERVTKQKQAIHDENDVVPYLRALKFSAAEARLAAERCADMPPESTLEERVRMALKSIRIRGTRVEHPATAMSPA